MEDIAGVKIGQEWHYQGKRGMLIVTLLQLKHQLNYVLYTVLSDINGYIFNFVLSKTSDL